MSSTKRIIRDVFIFIILIVITFVIIFNNYNIKETFDMICNANLGYILLALLCMCLYFVAEGLNNKNILDGLGNKISLFKSIKYPIIGFFFSGITPAAGGGQPMQVYFMNKDGIPSSNGTLSLLVQLIAFHAVTLAFGIFSAIFNYQLLSDGMIILFIVGVLLKTATLTVMYVCFRNRYAGKKIVRFVFNILRKFKIKNIEEKEENAYLVVEDYNNGAKYIRKHKGIFLKSICIIFLQVIAYYTLSYFVYRSFGLNSYSWLEIVTIQSVLYVSVSSIPLPGTVGVSEGAFLSIYEYVYGAEMLAGAMVVTRSINFYLFMILCAFVTAFCLLKNMKNNKVSK